MRRAECQWNPEAAASLLARAEIVQLATTTPEGKPILRPLQSVVHGNFLAFHGACLGEKAACLGRQAVVGVERLIADIPSTFIDPELACPATTYYESAQISGPLQEVLDLERKAEILAALTRKYQPEGGYRPIEIIDKAYRKRLQSLLIFGVSMQNISGKLQLGQRRKTPKAEEIAAKLWQRGAPEAPAAVDRLAAERGRPAFLEAPEGLVMRAQMGEAELAEVCKLLRPTYWNQGVSIAEMEQAHRSSSAWVGCLENQGRVVGSARAVADGSKFAWILDVIVAESARGKGVGAALMRLLLDHPRLRDCRQVGLVTRDATTFYERFGFAVAGAHPSGYAQMFKLR
jgi:nitroimidazol reductase NimA-like FMN-containing flavoprotein (pyridoxamine 5'-phosphate oxidase superfamily)/GNAT superfamily N-acetyltransferase